ncbi:MAG: SpoIID/LytB domain-containing protein [Candidatus Eremiobacteraeota bacterium]|nr:SpoIID/LytB domain-containing protein [Candidatus Eremiobacteraeota bacterium]
MAQLRRSSFLALIGAPLLSGVTAGAQGDADPAQWSAAPALRVLLGAGSASPLDHDLFAFNGRPFRGTFSRLADGQIVNLVDLEAYLLSVVAAEMPSRWPAEALQAQSICARTYVLQRSDPRRGYDLIPSQLDQVYDGVTAETPAATAAVRATPSTVLKYGSNFARVAYSSCCGGHTEASDDAWGGAPVPYLGGVACDWCAASPNFRWSRTIALDDLATRLAADVPPAAQVRDVKVAARDASGRARAVEIVTPQGSTFVPGTTFRRALGSRELPSLLISEIERDPSADQVTALGGGLGHGVGLCQWGARGMALAARGATEILAAYFPTTTLARLDR